MKKGVYVSVFGTHLLHKSLRKFYLFLSEC